jgi:hypothetical protein
MKYTPEPGQWHFNATGGWIYSDVPDGIIKPGYTGAEDTTYYGGFLVCETVASTFGPLIQEAPLLLDLAKRHRKNLISLGSLLATSAFETERKTLHEIEQLLGRLGEIPQ